MMQFVRWLIDDLRGLFAEPKGLSFGGMVVPDDYGEGGFMLVGAPGTGKSVVLDAFLRQILASLRSPVRSDRAMIYDPKRQYVSKLQRIGLYDPVSAEEKDSGFRVGVDSACVIITNPLDERAYSWELARDFDHILDGEQLAEIFTTGASSTSDRSEFFVSTSKQLFAAVFRVLHRRNPYNPKVPGSGWSLRDFVLAFESRDDLAKLLCQEDDTRAVWREYLGEEISRTDTGPSVYASLRTYLAKLSAVAAAWHAIRDRHPERTFSFRQWVNDRTVVLLGKSPRHAEHVQLVNRLMFHKASLELRGDHAQHQPNRNTWVALDELPELGYLSELQNLMAVGRSWGVRVVFAFQDYSQLEKCFGPEDARTITSLAHTFGALNCSFETAEWVSKLFGVYRDEKGEQRHVPAGDLMRLPLNPQRSGVVGWYYSKRLDERKAQRHVLSWAEVEKSLLKPRRERDEQNRKDESDYILKGWENKERARLEVDQVVQRGELATFDFSEDILKWRIDGPRPEGTPTLRRVPFEGETLQFTCTDAELAEFMRPKTLHALWWKKQSNGFKSRWLEQGAGLTEPHEIEALNRRMYDARAAERRSGRRSAE